MADITETTLDDEVSMTNQTTPKSSGAGGRIRSGVKAKLAEQGDALRGQAQAKALEYAEQGKSKAADTLDGISRFFDDTARTLDDRLGGDIGAYVHRAADAVAGFTDSLKQKDVEALLEDAREAVRRNPALAIGAAAVAGFVLVRLLKSASPTHEPAASAKPKRKAATSSRTGKAPSAAAIQVDS